jgi:hypothetical protein
MVTDVVHISIATNRKFDHEIWIGDSGAYWHYSNSNEGLSNYKIVLEKITVGNGNVMMAKKMGNILYVK